jgi:hypothetical protein
MHSMLRKPKVSEVKEWILMPEDGNAIAQVYYADIDDAFIKVTGKKVKTKYFYGENAWSDSRRYAYDAYIKELHK